ncbi:MAG: OmpH family outer membrane protein [Victivallales bacterium]|nr:OmpH family outer membrane protein [Victivallales bacterium]
MKKTNLQLFISALILLVSFSSFAAQKIAVINMDKVFNSYYKTKIENTRIQKQSQVYKDYLIKLNKAREKLYQEFMRLRDASQNIAYSDGEREKNRIAAQNKYRQLQAKDVEIKQYNEEKREKLMAEFKKVKTEILNEIDKVIKSIGIREKYTLILDSSGNSLNSIPSVVYFNKYIDITPEVIKRLNMGHEKK